MAETVDTSIRINPNLTTALLIWDSHSHACSFISG